MNDPRKQHNKNTTGKAQDNANQRKHAATSSEVGIDQKSSGGEERHKGDQKHQNWLQRIGSAFEGKSEMLVTASTVVMAIFTGLLYNLTLDTNRNSIATQRAFVTIVDSMNVKSRVFTDGTLTAVDVEVVLENSGVTPAIEAFGHVNYASLPAQMPHGYEFRDSLNARPVALVIGPKARATHTFRISTDDLLKNGHYSYFYGWVVYRDIFEDTPPRLTQYCFEINNINPRPTDLRGDANIGWTISPCRVAHNCVDEFCADYEGRIQRYRNRKEGQPKDQPK